jgi:hypothetical protein
VENKAINSVGKIGVPLRWNCCVAKSVDFYVIVNCPNNAIKKPIEAIVHISVC